MTKLKEVLTTALNSKSEIGEHVKKHGDGVKVIALWVDDAKKAYKETIERGAKSYLKPITESDESGEVIKSEFSLMVKQFIYLLNVRIIMETFYLGLLDGSLTITLAL